MNRRKVLGGMAATGASFALGGCTGIVTSRSQPKVVIVGGGYGGATAAKYIRMFSNAGIEVTLIEPNEAFVSCPISNLVLSGTQNMAAITSPYSNLSARYGVRMVRDSVSAIDLAARTVTLASGGKLSWDKLVVSPGVELMFGEIEGLDAARQSGQCLQAWKAGPETTALRKQLEDMPDGGVFAIAIPEAPYRCPPGPYERASVVAAYFRRAKPRSKVLILDANQDVTSKGPLFKKAWAEMYAGMIEYRPQYKVIEVDARNKTLKFDVQSDVKADVLNVLPPMRAGSIAVQAGLANVNARWCNVHYKTFESTAAAGVHVIGDSIQIAPLMPKSAHMANSHAKVTAAAIVAQLSGLEVNPAPMLTNTCYSFVADKEVIHVASVHQYVEQEKTFKTVPGAGGVSAARNEQEAIYAMAWARNIWADTLN